MLLSLDYEKAYFVIISLLYYLDYILLGVWGLFEKYLAISSSNFI
jgi:hypothetical protein